MSVNLRLRESNAFITSIHEWFAANNKQAYRNTASKAGEPARRPNKTGVLQGLLIILPRVAPDVRHAAEAAGHQGYCRHRGRLIAINDGHHGPAFRAWAVLSSSFKLSTTSSI